MYPVLFYIGNTAVKTSWLLNIAGISAAFLILRFSSSGEPVSFKNKLFFLAFLLFFPFLGGMHIGYIIESMLYGQTFKPFNIMGPYSLIWGFIISILCAFPFSKMIRIDIYRAADHFALAIPAAMIFTRIGCLFNGCCRGIPVSDNFPFAVFYPGADSPFHPAPLYEALAWVLILFILLFKKKHSAFKGSLMVILMILYSFFRFIIDFFREYEPACPASRILTLFLFTCFIIYYIIKKNLQQ